MYAAVDYKCNSMDLLTVTVLQKCLSMYLNKIENWVLFWKRKIRHTDTNEQKKDIDKECT
jgi:hypothetical protein